MTESSESVDKALLKSATPTDATVVLSADQIKALTHGLGTNAETIESGKTVLTDELNFVLAPGTRLAEFEITGVIGQGGFGIVYQAQDSSLQREVAIKEYMPTSLAVRTTDGSIMARSTQQEESFTVGLKSFVNEARLLAQFDHPSLLKVYRFWDERGTTYMVMPFYRGKTLKQVLAKNDVVVNEPWLRGVLDGVTQALALIHAADCYHRDIAPDNIMLVGDSHHPVVLDFGAARRVVSGMTQALTVILKPGYAPVEQYADSPDFKQGPWTDVYALGAVIYGAIAKKSPPPSVTRLLSDTYQPLVDNEHVRAQYSLTFLSAIDRALAVRPEDRPQSMGEFRDLLGLNKLTGADSTVYLPPIKSTVGQSHTATEGRSTTPVTVSSIASAKRRFGLPIGAGLLAIVSALVGYFVWMAKSPTTDPRSVVGSNASVDKALSTKPPSPSREIAAQSTADINPGANASVPQALPLSAAAIFDLIQKAASSDLKITASVRSSTVKIAAKEKLEFSVQSAVDGYLYVYLLSSGGELFQLFPNQLDKRNRVKANDVVKLPRASWPMEAGGPPGTNRFIALVSPSEREFSSSGIIEDGFFGRFKVEALAMLESGKVSGSQPAITGKPKCAAEPVCDNRYGAASFTITEE